jgi:hypothetical protein
MNMTSQVHIDPRQPLVHVEGIGNDDILEILVKEILFACSETHR